MTQPRSNTIDPAEVQIVHVYNRCVRRAYLCGIDPVTGKDYEYRKTWSRNRLKHLASCFAMDVVAYSIMDNHTHQILRSRPDVAKTWSDREVVERWLRISQKNDEYGNVIPAKESRIQSLVEDKSKVETYRRRLADISWWMRYFSQYIAVRCNREDEITGHFWESRFGHSLLVDDVDILACMIYVDLNPVRAGVASSPETSDFTSVKDRVDDLRITLVEKNQDEFALQASELGSVTHEWERIGGEFSGWLAPIEIDEKTDPIGPDAQASDLQLGPNSSENHYQHTPESHPVGRRCSRKGVLPIPLARYLTSLDEAGKKIRNGKRGSISLDLKPIFERLKICEETFNKFYDSIDQRCRKYQKRPPATLLQQNAPTTSQENFSQITTNCTS